MLFFFLLGVTGGNLAGDCGIWPRPLTGRRLVFLPVSGVERRDGGFPALTVDFIISRSSSVCSLEDVDPKVEDPMVLEFGVEGFENDEFR